ncbi:MAG: hypothetical protein PVI00_09290 [Desulfobacterales bacterium]
MVSSDWNECLAPCGPFDSFSFAYPHLVNELEAIFKQYTGNIISLSEAVRQLQQLLPNPVTPQQMDNYLDKRFATYRGVSQLIDWCKNRSILFMINTTGMIGYFQRVFAKTLLPEVPLLSAHPMVRYEKVNTDPEHVYNLFETTDKSKNTESVMHHFNIPADKIILMGDSGGDGPHFEWGAEIDALLVASMAKPSLKRYCEQKQIPIDILFGYSYAEGDPRNIAREMQVNFMDLVPIIEDIIV